jgi:hypothetical protein
MPLQAAQQAGGGSNVEAHAALLFSIAGKHCCRACNITCSLGAAAYAKTVDARIAGVHLLF